jgi:hypothetical protein
LVELFTSQGCSSCPPAERLLNGVEEINPRAVALAFHVDYWDSLGWKDPFSNADWSRRQHAYVNGFKLRSAYTPQIVVGGRTEFNGSDRRSLVKALESAENPEAQFRMDAFDPSPDRNVPSGTIMVALEIIPSNDFQGDRNLCLAVTESQLKTPIPRGENEGKILEENFVVRRYFDLGKVALKSEGQNFFKREIPVLMEKGWNRKHLRAVAFLQDTEKLTVNAAAWIALGEK